MIIIDEDADKQLVQVLKGFLRAPDEMTCVQFNFVAEKADIAEIHARLPAFVAEEISAEDKKIYFCESGEIYILGSNIQMRESHKLALRIIKTFNISTLECGFNFLNLRDEAGKLVASLEQRMMQQEQKLQAERDALKKREGEARLQQKRQSILNIMMDPGAGERIRNRRTGREAAEIMVIEDDLFSRKLVESTLGKTYQVTGLPDAVVALPTYVNVAPDVVFLDINLPDVTGHELLEKILMIDPEAYVVMLSGNADRDNVMEAMKRGAKGFVAKPFTPDKLQQYIQRCPTIH